MQIITDSAADLLPDEIRQYGIKIVPLTIMFPNAEEVSASDISADDFYNRLRTMIPQVPTTSQPSPGLIATFYKAAAEAGEDILSIHVSSGLSGTANAAKVARQQVPNANIHVVDSMTLSPGERFQVLAAAMAAQKGWSADQIIQRLDAIRASSEAIFTLETLDYLARGGRIGRVQALAGGLLSIKPIIHVDKQDGKYSTFGRVRTISQAMSNIVNHVKTLYDADKPLWVTVVHGQFAEKAQQLEALARAQLNVAKLDTVRISPVLGVHTGPGIVGMGTVPIEHFQDLL